MADAKVMATALEKQASTNAESAVALNALRDGQASIMQVAVLLQRDIENDEEHLREKLGDLTSAVQSACRGGALAIVTAALAVERHDQADAAGVDLLGGDRGPGVRRSRPDVGRQARRAEIRRWRCPSHCPSFVQTTDVKWVSQCPEEAAVTLLTQCCRFCGIAARALHPRLTNWAWAGSLPHAHSPHPRRRPDRDKCLRP